MLVRLLTDPAAPQNGEDSLVNERLMPRWAPSRLGTREGSLRARARQIWMMNAGIDGYSGA
jgi:hypothetical protein